jgi:uncharacterized protein (DUF1330 family)
VHVLQHAEAEVALSIVLLVVDKRETTVERRDFLGGMAFAHDINSLSRLDLPHVEFEHIA